MHRNIAWDKVVNLSPQSTPQVLPSFEVYTPPMTYPEEVEKTLGTPIEVEPLHEPPLEVLSLNTCNHDIPLSSREVLSFDKMKPLPQPQPLPNCPPLDISLGDKIGPKPPIKPHSLDSFRMKALDHLTIYIPPSPYVASSHPKDTYFFYHPCLDDPKKHYGFKLGRGLNLPVRLKEVENVVFEKKKLGRSYDVFIGRFLKDDLTSYRMFLLHY
nr:ribonuclease H-like domain-containing protein [Tanacetum cinerariifolium]